jgi:hypothetical protein
MSDRQRWVRNATEAPRWDDRNRLIAAFVPEGVSVLDLGAGAMTLREHLPDGCRYQAVDLVPGPAVAVHDFNAGEYPELGEVADLAVCSGVLEYLGAPGALLERLPRLARRSIVSYAPWRPSQGLEQRTAAGWVNHLTMRELDALLTAAGLEWQLLAEWRGQAIVVTGVPGAREPALREPAVPPQPDRWEEGLAALRALAAREGHTYLAAGAVVAGFPLGDWVREQQAAWRDGTLALPHARALETLPGWGWTPGEARWNQRVREVRLHPAGRPLPPRLASWLEEQRRLHAGNALHPDRARVCEALGAWSAIP